MPANLLLRDTHPPVARCVHSITPMTLRVVAQASRSESAGDIMSPELVSAPESLAGIAHVVSREHLREGRVRQ